MKMLFNIICSVVVLSFLVRIIKNTNRNGVNRAFNVVCSVVVLFFAIIKRLLPNFKKPTTLTYSYELFTWQDGGVELWRTSTDNNHYSETRFMNRWVSDYGSGDYLKNKRNCQSVISISPNNIDSFLTTYTHWDELDFRQDIGHEVRDVTPKS